MSGDDFASRPVVIFDGYCNICSSLIIFAGKIDKAKKIRFLPFQTETYKSLLKTYHNLPENPGTVILIQQNKIYERSDAVLKIFHMLGFPWTIIIVVKILPKKMLDAVYIYIASRRYAWSGRRNECMIPNNNKF